MDLAAAHTAVLNGLPFGTFDRLVTESGFMPGELAATANIPPTTLARRRREGRFSRDESAGILRFRFLFDKARELFEGDADAAREWLKSPVRGLGGQVPMDLARTGFGAKMVEDLIERLEDGVFS
jgi:putative toxin-antitoxin system antitoxin component (TIGR02293 family)